MVTSETAISVLAFDLGASSGRAVVGQFDGQRLSLKETHRFSNDPVRVHQHLHWDILRLLHEVKQGMRATRLDGFRTLQSVGIDTWGVDFGLLDVHGQLLSNPHHYRDGYTTGMIEEVWHTIPHEKLFKRTGIQSLSINTLYQLYALKKARPHLLDQADTFLMIPDLLLYFLTGERHSEWTNASTTQLCNPITRSWDRALMEQLGLPSRLFLDPVEPATVTGRLLPLAAEEMGLAELPVIAVAEHDTASAVAAIPATEREFAYLSSGTWSLIGTEVGQPVLSEQALQWNVSNEGGINGTVRLLKNVTGLWLVQECLRAWRNEGKLFSRHEEMSMTEHAKPFQSFIDPDDPSFSNPMHMPRAIQQYCRKTGQRVPEHEGAILRCIIESLACKYRLVLERIEQLAGTRYPGLYIVGGGSQHKLLCQYTANVLGRPVWVGSQETTAIGNIVVQLLALGHLENIQQARQLIRDSFPLISCEAQETEAWEQAFQQFCHVIEA